MKHFFIDEKTGKLFVIPEMPEDYKSAHYQGFEMPTPYSKEIYQSSLQSAKAKAVEVDNQDEVIRKIQEKDQVLTGAFYPLECEAKMVLTSSAASDKTRKRLRKG